jgi:TolB-like protein
VLLIGFDVGSWREKPLARATPVHIRSIAVLPLENLSGDPAQEYFTDGMTDALVTELAQISSLRVISRTSVMRYKGTRKPLPDIAKELSVDGIVEGSVVQSAERVRVNAQLIEAATDRHLWASMYERSPGDVVILQSEVARAIAKAIQVQLTPQEQARLTRVQSVDPQAYESYLKGRYFWNKRTFNRPFKGTQTTRLLTRAWPRHTSCAATFRLKSSFQRRRPPRRLLFRWTMALPRPTMQWQ